jgi:hypothetical protein
MDMMMLVVFLKVIKIDKLICSRTSLKGEGKEEPRSRLT